MWDEKIFAQYWRALLDNARKHIEPMVEFVAGQDLFDSISTEVVRHIKNNEVLVTERDKALISILICRENLCINSLEDFSSEPLYSDIQTFFNAKLTTLSKITSGKVKIKNSTLEKNLEKYLCVSRKNHISIQCNQFCANARLLLTFKGLSLNSNAKNKSDTLYWLGVKTNPPQNFRLEDYWFYEQQTGVNLSVEISALLDKLYNDYKNHISSHQKGTWSILEDIICFCIEENYRYIAYVPAIDWKISVMKLACTIVGKELADAFLEKRDSALQPLATEIIASGILSPQNKKIDSRLSDYTQLLVLQKLSSVFNQVLSICIMYTLGDATAFAKKSKLSNKRAWVDGQQFTFLKQKYNKIALQEKVAEHEKQLQTQDGSLAGRKDTLVFCSSDNQLVGNYINELTEFINFNKAIFDETENSTVSIAENNEPHTQTQKLKIAIPSLKNQMKKLERVQIAIRAAIEASNQF